MSYLKYNSKNFFSNNTESVKNLYEQGYLFTRKLKGDLYQTRSLRIDLSKFKLNSENKRILRKNENLKIESLTLPLMTYSWEIHKMGKEFYQNKFGDGTMSASKIKEMFQDTEKSNMNLVFQFSDISTNKVVGYCLCFQTDNFVHYAYPFYDLEYSSLNPNVGLGMMLKSILWSNENGLEYIYLGSVKDKSAKYKLQFKGLEWWNIETNTWENDIEKLKELI